MPNTDKYGFEKIRKGAWWEILNNYKISGMKITLTLKQNPRGRPKSKIKYFGTVDNLHWDDMDEYVSIKDEDQKIHRFMIEDLYRLETYKKGDEIETNESNES